MIRIIKNIVLILILLIGLMTIYLSYLKYQLRHNSIMVDSFAFSSKNGDTLNLSCPLVEDTKDILFLVHCYSDEYGGETFSMSNITSGGLVFQRSYQTKDSSLLYKNHKINIGGIFNDSIIYQSKRNIFRIVKNRLVIKNEGFIKTASIGFFPQKKVTFDKPVLLITGDSYDSHTINVTAMIIYKSLPYALVTLGLIYWFLQYTIKRKKHSRQARYSQ